VDLTIATLETVQLIKQTEGEPAFIADIPGESVLEGIAFVKDPTSNGYISYLLNRLGVEQYKCEEVKNCDFKEFTFEVEGTTCKMAKCYGFRNIQKIVQMVKKGKCPYHYVEIMACPGGCFGGGGQIRYDTTKNKETIGQFEEMMKKYRLIDGSERVGVVELGLSKEELHVRYKPIEKSLSEAVMNW
jgi:iron only hydrogenase large subunit-like protein